MVKKSTAVHRNSSPKARFWDKVYKTNHCWFWIGVRSVKDYGMFSLNRGIKIGAHRFSYELAYGPIPTGYHIDHLCMIPSCVNPDHLEAVTFKENIRRGRLARGVFGATIK